MGEESHETSVALTILAHICGWIYFTAWTISFYPQLISNYHAKSTEGLSITFAVFNLIGFIALAQYDIIRYGVQLRYDLPQAVEIQDVCFAVHAAVLCIICCLQFIHYDSGWRERVTRRTWIMSVVLIVAGMAHLLLVEMGVIPLTHYPDMDNSSYLTSAWSFTNFCGALKLGITLFKYLPQIVLNFERQMTNGLAIWTFNLDCVGGIFSLIQNGVESINHRNSAYITGNLPKVGIGLVGLTYNAIILGQHYYLYREQNFEAKRIGGEDTMSGKLTTGDDGVDCLL
ncbi:cystinosin [Gregarina niphandrodes]|uniref:Cystinosin n=1 Tax=Gregarina niphandrodes TaxID=110365 RepID=A0A023BAE4_GRENI|nr:cystinosin [Gregarina niphandrodes]EZG78214.1 cystinosin [Gregarina niphandrodes]|eukprot:XP_011129403.1 cystinosin [Gregarina niphandrodes]